MKQILSIIAVAAVVSVTVVTLANKSTKEQISASEMAQFKEWQNKNENAITTTATKKQHSTYQSPKAVSVSQNAAKTKEKKGWSKAAKGTVIGAASGAVIGAVINKRNRTTGAVVGGILGAGAGYGIGRSIDKKDGRS